MLGNYLEVKDAIITLMHEKPHEYPIKFKNTEGEEKKYTAIIIAYNNKANFMKIDIEEDSKFKIDFGAHRIRIDIEEHHAHYGSKLELLIWDSEEYNLREKLRKLIGDGIDNF